MFHHRKIIQPRLKKISPQSGFLSVFFRVGVPYDNCQNIVEFVTFKSIIFLKILIIKTGSTRFRTSPLVEPLTTRCVWFVIAVNIC